MLTTNGTFNNKNSIESLTLHQNSRENTRENTRVGNTRKRENTRVENSVIKIQKVFRGYLIKREIYTVIQIFHEIEKEINSQVFGSIHDQNEMISRLELKKKVLNLEQEKILNAFHERLNLLQS